MNIAKRRLDCPDKEQIIYKKAEKEYQLFRCKMLSLSSAKLYRRYKKIYFYECLNEYMLYKEKLDGVFVEAAYQREGILKSLWKLYQKHEYLNAGTWEGIEEILREYTRQYGKNDI
jgi:hypothetical protein